MNGVGSPQFGAGLSEYLAETTAACRCASLGIVPTVRHAGCIGSWVEVLRQDFRAIIRALSAVSRSADYLLSFRAGPDTAGNAAAPNSQEPSRTA